MKQKDKSKDYKIQLINKAKNDINLKKHLKLEAYQSKCS